MFKVGDIIELQSFDALGGCYGGEGDLAIGDQAEVIQVLSPNNWTVNWLTGKYKGRPGSGYQGKWRLGEENYPQFRLIASVPLESPTTPISIYFPHRSHV